MRPQGPGVLGTESAFGARHLLPPRPHQEGGLQDPRQTHVWPRPGGSAPRGPCPGRGFDP